MTTQISENKQVKMLETTEKTLTIENLYTDHRAQLRYDLIIQRNKVWDNKQRSLFIHTILINYPFPEVYAQNKEGYWFFLDGKQRMTCVFDYLDGAFTLEEDTPDVYGYEIGGKTINELSEGMQRKIKSTVFRIIFFENMTIEQRDELFFRLNNGTPLSSFERNRSKYSQILNDIENIARMPFFADTMPFTETARTKMKDQELVYLFSMLLDKGKDFQGIGNKHISLYIDELKREKKGIQRDTLEVITYYLQDVFSNMPTSSRKRILKKNDIIAIFVQSIRCVNEGVTEDDYSEFIEYFFSSVEKEDAYSLTKVGATKKENILARIRILEEALEEWLVKRAMAS